MSLNLTPEQLEELNLTHAEALEIVTPIKIGPTWQTKDDGSWDLPEYTLGWHIAAWCADYLKSPKGGPWKFTTEQLRFVLWWYAVDEHGEWIYHSGVLQRCKGWGKDPLLAVLCLVEFVGPSRFSHWGEDGQPVGMRVTEPWVQVAAVSQTQTKNTMRALPGIFTDRLKNEFGIKTGAELWRALGGGAHLEAVTSNYRALEGGRSTFVVLNETHHWVTGNGGHSMYETIDGNATKMAGRYLAITNAYLPGEDSVAERMRNAYMDSVEGRLVDAKVMYDSLEAHAKAPLSGPLLDPILAAVRGDSYWLKPEQIKTSISKGNILPSRSRRMWLNQIVASEEALHGPETWDPLGIEASLEPGDVITLGFDGGKTDDATALIAIRASDNCAFKLGVWEAPEWDKEWEVDRRSVDSAVRMAFADYEVVGFFADVALWESYIDTWADDYGEQLLIKASGKHPIAWDMRSGGDRTTRAHEALVQSIFDGKLKHNRDLTLRRHTLNAQRWVNKYGLSFQKESRESPRKVDAYAALMIAHEALRQFRLSGKQVKKPTGLGYFL